MDFNIPTEVKDKSAFPQIKKLDRQIIAAAVLMGLNNQDAFRLFHPEYADMRGGLNEAGKQDSKHFWGYGKTKDYREQYEKELAEFLGRKQTSRNVDTEIDDNRIEGALKKLLNQTIGLLDNGDNLDPDSVKTIVEVFRKMNLLKDEVEQEIKPVRVLPTRCKSECRYRLFVETAKLEKQICDDCDYCKARKFAEEHGFVYDPCTVLDLPEDVIAEIDSHNDVKLLDILDGKVEN